MWRSRGGQSSIILPIHVVLFVFFYLSGMMDLHQVTWDKKEFLNVSTRTLSCFSCDTGSVCCHFKLGKGQVAFVMPNKAMESLAALELVTGVTQAETEVELITEFTEAGVCWS